jgi:hypothetical protein
MNAISKISSGTVIPLPLYDAMCRAIAAAHDLDEVIEMHDRGAALVAYTRQAKDEHHQRLAEEVWRRAERRAGELLAERDMAKGAAEPGTNRGATPSQNGTASTLADLGITRKQSSAWQKLARVPEKTFERAMEEPSLAGLRSVIREALVEQLGEPPDRYKVTRLRPKPDPASDALTDFAGAVRAIALLADMPLLASRVQPELIDWYLENCRTAQTRIEQFVSALAREGNHAA